MRHCFGKRAPRFELEDYSETLQACEELLQRFPNSRLRYRAEFFIAESTYWREQTPQAYQSARQKYQALLKKQSQIAPDAIDAEWAEKCRYGIGWTHFSEATLSKDTAEQQKHYREAVSAWQEVLANHATGALADKTQYHIGIAYVNLKQYDDGIQTFKQVLSDYSGSNWGDNARYQTGWVLYKQEKYPQAIAAFNEMLKVHPGRSLFREPSSVSPMPTSSKENTCKRFVNTNGWLTSIPIPFARRVLKRQSISVQRRNTISQKVF